MKVVDRKFTNGERRSILVDASGIPLYYPNLFVTLNVRNRGQSANTVKRINYALKRFMSWQICAGIDVSRRIQDGIEMQRHEVASLMEFLSYSKETRKKLEMGAKLLPASYEYRETKNTIADRKYVSEYIAFLIQRLHPSVQSATIASNTLNSLKKQFCKARARKKEAETDVDEAQFNLIESVVEPGSTLNPFKRHKLRNKCIIRLMLDLGLRRGEIANLLVGEIDFGRSVVKVRRKQDDPDDPRPSKPNAKTSERTLHLEPDLKLSLLAYIKERGEQEKSFRHGYLFTTQSGNPVSEKQIYNIVVALRKVKGVGHIYPHLFRHWFNHVLTIRFREEMRKAGITSPADKMTYDARRRSYLNGWSEDSDQQKHYGRQWITELSDEATLERISQHE